EGTVRLRLEAASAVIWTLNLPVIVPVAVSVAVMLCAPAVSRVALKLPWPLVSVASLGMAPGAGSLVVKCSVPAYPVAVFPYGSWAVTVHGMALPAGAVVPL